MFIEVSPKAKEYIIKENISPKFYRIQALGIG